LRVPALRADAEAYVQYLSDHGYAASTIKIYVESLAHFTHWRAQQQIPVTDLDDTIVWRFLDHHLSRCACAPRCQRTRHTLRAALQQWLVLLRTSGRIAGPAGADPPDIAHALHEFQHPPQAITSARRIEVLRSFARYWQLWEPETEIPPLRLFGPGHRRLTPHIYTEQEILALLTAAAHLPPSGSLRAACCVAIFGLLAATGLRIAEAVSLMRSDVDLARGRLHIRQTKGGKSRWVPLHATTTEALQQYAQARDQDPRSVLADAFFLGMHGRPAQCQQVQYAFRQLRQQLGWHARGGHPAPRIHDLRHTFICRRLERWYAEGRNIDHDILALTTYVGHAHVTSTYWYLTATPELLAIAAHRVEHVGACSTPPRATTGHRSARRRGQGS